MLEMRIEFDEERLNADNMSVEEFYSHLDEKFRRRGLNICEKGVYRDNGDEDDLFQFMVLAGACSEFDWFVKYVKRWIWYEDCDTPEDLIKTFELEKMRHD